MTKQRIESSFNKKTVEPLIAKLKNERQIKYMSITSSKKWYQNKVLYN